MSSVISPTSSSSVPTSTTSASPTPASALITSTGIGSGLNIGAIVSTLTAAYGAAQTNALAAKQSTLNGQVSAYGTFTSALDTLQATLATLENPSDLAGFTATVADKTIASATTSSDAVAGRYTLSVQNLATAANLTSQPFANAAAPVGTGTLTITVGAASTQVNIDATNNTLAGIAAAINSAPNNPGVNASVITTTGGARLVLSGTATGASNAITVTQTGGDGGLASLVYDPANNNTKLTQTQAAQNASFSINGFPVTSPGNVVTNPITGVTLTLLAPTAANTTTTLTISPDTTAAQTSIGTFVTALNGVLTSIQSLTGYDPTTQIAGPLNGNVTLESFQNQLLGILDQITSGGAGGVRSLADLGITANANGNFDTNSTTISNALGASLTSVGNLLGGANGIATKIDSLINSYAGPGGLISTIKSGLQTSLSNVATQQRQLNAQLAAYSAVLTREYNAMDAAVAALKQTQTYLTAEFNPNSSSSSSSANSSLSGGTLSTGG